MSPVLSDAGPELPERREEVIVAVQRRIPVAHRHRVDRLAEERAVLQHGGDRRLTGAGVARPGHDRHRRRREAQPVVGRPAQIALGVDRARQMIVKVAALRHLARGTRAAATGCCGSTRSIGAVAASPGRSRVRRPRRMPPSTDRRRDRMSQTAIARFAIIAPRAQAPAARRTTRRSACRRPGSRRAPSRSTRSPSASPASG